MLKRVLCLDPGLETNDTMFSCLSFSLAFKRKPTYFMLNVILPSILINFLCIFNFIIPCETGEKVGYGITVFLAQSVNLMVVSEMMPQGGDSVLGYFLVASILLIGQLLHPSFLPSFFPSFHASFTSTFTFQPFPCSCK